MDFVTLLIGAVVGALAPLTVVFMQRRQQQESFNEQEERARLLLEAAQEKADATAKEAVLKGKAELLQQKERMEEEYDRRNQELGSLKKRLDKREEHLDRKLDQLDQREREQEQRRRLVEEERTRLMGEQSRQRELQEQARLKLEEVAGMTAEDARQELKAGLEERVRRESARFIKDLEEEARQTADKKARELLAATIQRYAGEFVAERTVSVVNLPSDDMKGRIIGREGRNIRALEAATGCDLIIDDTPEAVVVSGFNPVRRQVAKRALEELITDGRIHPARIEEVVKKTTKIINTEIREAGEQAVYQVGLHNVHPEIIRLLGTLKFRTSYTQNVLQHSIEVAFFAGMIAEELGLDGAKARRCGLLHDIGKAVDHEMEGSHAILGGQFARKYKEDPLVVNAISAHHFEVEPESIYAPLTNTADALSAARPGARRESMDTYARRLEDLEKIASGFNGVDKAYAVQAGRELRVMVSYDRVNDEGSMLLARDIARKVEEEMSYPGQIKVTVIREMRATEIAH